MEAFLGALRYVEVVEVQGEAAAAEGQQEAAAGEAGGWLWAKEAARLWLEKEAGEWRVGLGQKTVCSLSYFETRGTTGGGG